jgi:uncharacterized protein with ATP-grasp and redox domains
MEKKKISRIKKFVIGLVKGMIKKEAIDWITDDDNFETIKERISERAKNIKGITKANRERYIEAQIDLFQAVAVDIIKEL